MKVTVQSVLYRTPVAALERYLHGFEIASDHLRDAIPNCTVEIRWGDASPTRGISPEVLDQWSERFAMSFALHYQFFDENLGHGGGQNRLASESDADIIVFANPDLVPLDDALSQLCSALIGDPETGIVDGKQIPLEHPKHFEYQTGRTSWCSGAFSAVRRTEFAGIGMFDEKSFFMHGDDVDLSWRYRLAGYKCMHQPAAVAFHDKRLSESGQVEPSPLERRNSARAALLLAHKYGRDDLLAETLDWLLSGSAPAEQAEEAREFVKQRERGQVTEPLHGADGVAEFVSGAYGRHRW